MSRMTKARHLEEARRRLNDRIGLLHRELETEGNRFQQHHKEGEVEGLEAGVRELNQALGLAYDPLAPAPVWGYDG